MRYTYFLILFTTISILLVGCGSSSSESSTAFTESISISFEAKANNTTIDCDTQLTGLGSAGTDADLKDFRLYLHAIEFETDRARSVPMILDENIWQSSGVALIDFQNKDDSCSGAAKVTNKVASGKVVLEEGESITGLNFRMGLPSELNHQNPTTANTPMNISSLTWSWQAGYKFMRVDIAPVGGVTRPTDGSYNNTTWNMHLGSTNCSGDPQSGEDVVCGFVNRPQINLSGFTPGTSTIVVDYGNLVANANVGQDEAGAPGCMSGSTDPECQSLFTALGLDLATGNANSSQTQSVFRIE